jgi:hypothetical protein
LEDPELFHELKALRGPRPWISINNIAVLVPVPSAAETEIPTLFQDQYKITIKLEDCTPVSFVTSRNETADKEVWRKGEPIKLGNSTWTLHPLEFDTPHVVSRDRTEILTIRSGYCRAIWHIRRDHEPHLPENYFLLVDIAELGGI